ncbi:hypothetical protein RIF29_41916 [Crotalaria pallida]|uniref:Glycosyltransferase n=1 Tax=Crotalaria pallida TaxID=3830 RepID=A0AAN9E6J0_CROPI
MLHHHHFLLITYPAQGHINPALQFSKQLINLGFHVTLSTTLHMHRRMSNKPTLPGLSYTPFSDGYDSGFKPTADTDYARYMSELKRHSSDFITDLIVFNAEKGHPFTCIVYTPILCWVAEAARAFHLPAALLWVQPATVFDIYYYYFHGYGDYIKDKTKEKESSCSIELPGLPYLLAPNDLPSVLVSSLSSSLNSLILPMFEEQFHELNLNNKETKSIVLVNTFEALEPEALRAVDNFNMISIGPLIPSDASHGGDIFQPSNDYIEWLDSKPDLSVVYVSFGSFCVLSKIQMEEIARALLDSGYSFIWVIREKEKKGEEAQKEELKEEEEELMSCIEELKKRGKIVKWCSQVEVLSHASLGCFVTHCGWNSTIESLVSGVPVVAFPQWTDQKTNAKLIEDVWKIGVRVDHVVNEEGVVKAEDIRKCLEVVMGSGEKGEELRRNAKEWKSLAREAVKEGGSSHNNLRAFLYDIDV